EHDLFGQAQIKQTGSHLIANALQELEFFHRVGNAIDAVGQNNQAKVTISGPQRDSHPISPFAKLRSTNLPQCLPPVVLDFFQIRRKSYCGRLKWRLTKRLICWRIFSESSNSARKAMATRTRDASSWKDAAPPYCSTICARTPMTNR